MNKVIVKNISRSKALELLGNVQNSICKGLAIQGKRGYECIHSDTVLGGICPKETDEDGNDLEFPDFNNYTFSISSNYWVESTLMEYANLELV